MLNIKKLFMQLEGKRLLWTNSSPTANFAAQTVPISNITGYDYVEVEFVSEAAPIKIRTSATSPFGVLTAAWAGHPNYRNVTITSAGVQFSDAFANSQTVNNAMIRPYRIYGIKKLGGVVSKLLQTISNLKREEVVVC